MTITGFVGLTTFLFTSTAFYRSFHFRHSNTEWGLLSFSVLTGLVAGLGVMLLALIWKVVLFVSFLFIGMMLIIWTLNFLADKVHYILKRNLK